MTRLVSIGKPGQGEKTYPPRIFFHVEKPPRPGSRRRPLCDSDTNQFPSGGPVIALIQCIMYG